MTIGPIINGYRPRLRCGFIKCVPWARPFAVEKEWGIRHWHPSVGFAVRAFRIQFYLAFMLINTRNYRDCH